METKCNACVLSNFNILAAISVIAAGVIVGDRLLGLVEPLVADVTLLTGVAALLGQIAYMRMSRRLPVPNQP